jgi:hypothetical protein
MTYIVQTWDKEQWVTINHNVPDAIDYEDAEDYIQRLYPDQKVISVIRKKT